MLGETGAWNNSGLGPVSRKSPDFSGAFRVTIFFLSSKRRPLEARNFAIILIFIPFTTYEKTSFPRLAGPSFTNGFWDPKSFPDFRETGLFRVPQFPLYLHNAEVLKPSNFAIRLVFLTLKLVKRSAFQNKRIAVLRLGFGA